MKVSVVEQFPLVNVVEVEMALPQLHATVWSVLLISVAAPKRLKCSVQPQLLLVPWQLVSVLPWQVMVVVLP